MKVKCVNIYNEATKEFKSDSNSLTIGKDYVVLEIYCNIKGEVSYRIVRDGEWKAPAIFLASQFEIVSEKVSSSWGISVDKDGFITISPKQWSRPGFWEDCYDGDPKSLEIYKQETRIMYEEEGMSA